MAAGAGENACRMALSARLRLLYRLPPEWNDRSRRAATKLWLDEESVAREWVEDSATTENLPPGTTLDTLLERGYVRFTSWGSGPSGFSQASDVRPDETHNPFRWHVEDKVPYPTLTRRAQFYVDHPWFIEADEALPRHKEDPKQGGDCPFVLTSGHNRSSVHSMTSPTACSSRPTAARRTSSSTTLMPCGSASPTATTSRSGTTSAPSWPRRR